MTDPAFLEWLHDTATALGTRIVLLPPYGSDAEPAVIDGRPGT